jgi:hypothetical protein
MPRRVIVDENSGPGSEIWRQYQQSLDGEDCEFLFISQTHRSIPDVEILDKLLQPDTVLLTADGVLHMRALERGFCSFTLDERGCLTRKRLADVRLTKPLPSSVHSALQADYRFLPVHDFAHRMRQGFTERQFKRYRTARRRIRSHFGSAAAISQVSVTVGSLPTRGGLLCGFVFHVAGNSGVKGLRATEGYCRADGHPADAAWPVLHALRDQYLLELDAFRTDLFIIPPATLELTRRLLEGDQPAPMPVHDAARRLLQQLAKLTLHPCVKGTFHDAMQAKLQQLVHTHGNEVTSLDFDKIALSLLAPKLARPPLSDD